MFFSSWLFNFERELERSSRGSPGDKELSVGARQEGVRGFIAVTRHIQENTQLQDRAGLSVTERQSGGKTMDGLLCHQHLIFSEGILCFVFVLFLNVHFLNVSLDHGEWMVKTTPWEDLSHGRTFQ